MKEANYLNMTKIMTAVKTTLKKAADWLASHKWHLVGLALIALLVLGIYARDLSLKRELSSLSSAYAQSVEQVKALEDKVTGLQTELDRKQEEIYRLQQEHDRAIEEVTADAYRKARTLSDNELLAAYNRLIDGARKRNADRERRDSSTEE
ncbi:hypothetical protein [Cloacibacillus sp. An23]|uniref:hypothetical protein n=1 Tax=Cloacibacillus sp. An23 TaxID=1965591 RepID=UPI00117809B8|nr:hypothetical protein [Cloacibacillus sp. An23]